MPGVTQYLPRLTPAPWMALGACRGCDPALFYPERGGDYASAKAVCATCPVIEECLEHAIDTREIHGVWGGTSERERRVMRRQRGLVRIVAECGTVAGYDRHRRRDEDACSACKTAKSTYVREYNARRTA